MSTSDFQLTEDKYLFTFQDETQLWISREFIEKYQQLPFYDIIRHSEKYDDGSYYVDMPSSPMNKVIVFLVDKNMDIFSLDLKDSYDIYKTLIEYSVTIDYKKQCDLLFHIKRLFFKYLKDNNYIVSKHYGENDQLNMPIDLLCSDKTRININGLINSQRKHELLYYSLLFKMMNITEVDITYDYASNIPLEYICPSCIQDIFPSLEELTITVTTNYKKTELLLNPNSEEYMNEYIRLFKEHNYRIENPEKYEYYTESDMNELNNNSSLNMNTIYSHKLIHGHGIKRTMGQSPKLYKYIADEAIYTNDYSQIEINQINDHNKKEDRVYIYYRKNKRRIQVLIQKSSSEWGISQLLRLFSYLDISTIDRNFYKYKEYDSTTILKALEEGFLDSLIKYLNDKNDDKWFNKIMSTHVFPNVTKFIYDDDEECFQLSSIKKECFPKLHIIQYDIEINISNFSSLFPMKLISMIDTIYIDEIDYVQEEEIVSRLADLALKYSIHIDIISRHSFDSSDSENVKILDSIKNNKQNIDGLSIRFKVNNNTTMYSFIDDKLHEIDVNNSLERFLKSDVLQHLNGLYVTFDETVSVEYLKCISNLFNDNTINIIHKLTINLRCIKINSSTEYLTSLEDIMKKLIPMSSIIRIEDCTMPFINRLVSKGCFHNTAQLTLQVMDRQDNTFCELYTTDNFPQLKSITIQSHNKNWLNNLFNNLCKCMNNNNSPSSSTIRLGKSVLSDDDYIYDPNASILQYKCNTNSYIDTIIGTHDKDISKYEVETLLDYYVVKDKIIGEYKQQLNDSAFIQENQVYYKFKKVR
ncbi:hypothetical protein WA158_006626 [Blastocystis sp. Blastoise]